MNDELVTIATTFDLVEAEFLRNHLEAQGINVYLADENIVGMYNLLANAVGGIKVKVLASDVDEAKIYIEEWENAEIIDEDFDENDDIEEA